MLLLPWNQHPSFKSNTMISIGQHFRLTFFVEYVNFIEDITHTFIISIKQVRKLQYKLAQCPYLKVEVVGP